MNMVILQESHVLVVDVWVQDEEIDEYLFNLNIFENVTFETLEIFT